MKINDELFDYFKQAGTIKHYQKNDIIYMQDDHADELCFKRSCTGVSYYEKW